MGDANFVSILGFDPLLSRLKLQTETLSSPASVQLPVIERKSAGFPILEYGSLKVNEGSS